MGERAGVCWGSDISNSHNNYERGLSCLDANHGRLLEFVNVEMVIDDYSARVIREWYTHIGGSPTRLQASTRYINYDNFDYVVPNSIKNNQQAMKIYRKTMDIISANSKYLEDELSIPREDAAMLLPLGMSTKIVDKRNLRNLIDMSHQRMCNRAYWEYRELFNNICKALSVISSEWEYLVDNYFMPKCKFLGYCPEKKSCGYYLTCKQEGDNL